MVGNKGFVAGVGRSGIPVKIATEFGTDLFSLFAADEFRKNGVQPLNLYKGNAMSLNVTSAMITENDRTFMSYGNGNVTGEKCVTAVGCLSTYHTEELLSQYKILKK